MHDLQAFNQATDLGFDTHILDIGGGFAGGAFNTEGVVQLGGVPDAVNTALAQHFPEQHIKVGMLPPVVSYPIYHPEWLHTFGTYLSFEACVTGFVYCDGFVKSSHMCTACR